MPAFLELLEIVLTLEIPISLCKLCSDARELKEEELVEGAKFSGMYDLAKKVAEVSVVGF